MPDEDRPEPLRIGGWVPPYRDTRGPLRPPVPPGRLGAIARRAIPASMWPSPSAAGAGSGRGRRIILAGATGTLIAVAGLAALGLRDDEPTGPSLAQNVVPAPPVPSEPVTVLPAPTSSSARPATTTPVHRPV